MKHHIDPKIDCVFKALLGSEENKNLLISFLNAILSKEFETPINSVEILNPYNEKEFINDKLSIVDVKAKDSYNHVYQIEIQLNNFSYLPARMIYNWADIYSKQIKSGDPFDLLKPTYSIWLLAENMIHHDQHYAHHYKLRDQNGTELNQHGGIFLLELDKFKFKKLEESEHIWLQFFKEGENLDDQSLPDWMQSTEMRQAMSTLKAFSEKEKQYDRYHARMEYLRIQRTIQLELEREREAKLKAIQREEVAMQEKELAMQEKEAALAELAQLKALLKQNKK
jgi:predicted transposase/invertase (TIGR01784 family)